MTNFDKIRSMTDEELKNFLASIEDAASDLYPNYCSTRCPHIEQCDSRAIIKCDVTDEMIIKEWGLREYQKED